MDPRKVSDRFGPVPRKADPATVRHLSEIASKFHDFCLDLNDHTVDGPYQTLMFATLEMALAYAQKSVIGGQGGDT